MDIIDSLILGIIQGLAEFLPISSSGHIEIGRSILGLNLAGDEALQFTVVLHIATVLSTLVILWKEFVPLCRSFFTLKNDDNTRYVWKILLSCIPVMFVGLLLKDQIEGFFGGGLTVVGICLIATAFLLTFAYLFRSETNTLALRRGGYKPRNITFTDAFVIGIAQSIAVLPGLSRSGTTIATGIMLGDKREEVAKFSFFMVIIPILGEMLLDVKDMLTGSGTAMQSEIGTGALIVGFIAAFVVGCIACKWMINIVKKGKLFWFAIYCAIMGIICLIY